MVDQVDTSASQRAAAAVYRARGLDGQNYWEDNRRLPDYESLLDLNFAAFTTEVGKLDIPPNGFHILDIGAGRSARAMQQLAREHPELRIAATFLSKPKFGDSPLPPNFEYRHTSAERLRGIPDNSVGAALAVYSTTYSGAPELVVSSVDRVLVPGGRFVARLIDLEYTSKTNPKFIETTKPSNPIDYESQLKSRGYTVIIMYRGASVIMEAVKPSLNHYPISLIGYEFDERIIPVKDSNKNPSKTNILNNNIIIQHSKHSNLLNNNKNKI